MKRAARRSIIDNTLILASRFILVSLVFWGFLLYTQNEWAMVKWPW